MEALESHFNNWFGVVFFIVLYSLVLLFVPFYKNMDKKPKGTYLAFVIAFAIEMHGIPFSMWLVSWIIGKNLPEGVLWGHTLVLSIGHTGMYIGIALTLIALFLILTAGTISIRNMVQETERVHWSLPGFTGISASQYTGLLLISLG